MPSLVLSVKQKTLLSKFFIHLACLLPLVYTYNLAIADELGGDPVESIIHFTGIGAFNLLLMTLCVSPVSKWLKSTVLLNNRRLLGLYAFTYAVFHVLNFLFFEVQFDFSLFINEVFDRPYITIGMVAILILIPLAVTSINLIRKRMGRKWQSLHNFSYLVVTLVAIHFYWSVKSEIIEPSIYIGLTIIVLSLRKRKLSRLIGIQK
jgi:sulfoxide reductase heme-binding subunit YedZ